MSKTTVNVAFDDDTLDIIDVNRGRIPRSVYINNTMHQIMNKPVVTETELA